MKEAIGGSWLYTLVIVLIALFTTFVSVTTNYNRSYKIKDHLISLIEANDGVTPDTLEQINTYLTNIGYSSTGKCPSDVETGEKWHPFTTNNTTGPSGYGSNVNYCIYKHMVVCSKVVVTSDYKDLYKSRSQTTKGSTFNTYPRAYYGVSTFFRLDWPILRYVIRLNLTGETSTIYMINYANSKEIDVFSKANECN